MDSRTHHGNGLTKSHLFNTNTITNITKEILETMVLLKKFTDLHLTTNQFFHNHGEELRKPTPKMDSRTQLGNGFHSQNKRRETLVTMVLLRKFTALLRTINQFYHNHGDVLRKLIQSMVSKTQSSNGSINQKLLLNKKREISEIMVL